MPLRVYPFTCLCVYLPAYLSTRLALYMTTSLLPLCASTSLCVYLSSCLPLYTIPKFPRRDSKPKKRLRENRAIILIKDNHTHGIALFSLSLFLGFEYLLGNSWMRIFLSACLALYLYVSTSLLPVEVRYDISCFRRLARNARCETMSQLTADAGFSQKSRAKRPM